MRDICIVLILHACHKVNALSPLTLLFKIAIGTTFGHLCCLLTHRPYWRCYYSNTDAIIYVVDSMDRDRIGISKQELVAMLEVKNSLLSLFCRSVCLMVVSCLWVYVSGASPPSGQQGQQYAHCDCEWKQFTQLSVILTRRVCVCVFRRERDENMCVYVYVSAWERESMCVCVCVCVCAWEREREHVCVSIVSMCTFWCKKLFLKNLTQGFCEVITRLSARLTYEKVMHVCVCVF